MNPYFLNDASNSISVHNSIVAGMSLGTVVNMNGLSKDKSDSNCVEMVKSVNPWLTDSILTESPIIQSPDDHTKEHPVLQQPVAIDYSYCDEAVSEIKTEEKRQLFKGVIDILGGHLQNESERKSYESESFCVSVIQEKHLRSIPKTKRKDHVTLGMRGAIANKDIRIGSPLIYSAQYLTDEQWLKAIDGLAGYLAREFNLYAKDTSSDAERRLRSYSYTPVEFQSERYAVSAYGAGNIGAMLNHDIEFFNMIRFNPRLLDKNGKPTVDVTVHYASRDIEKGEQLLVDYGQNYKFHTFLESRQKVYF